MYRQIWTNHDLPLVVHDMHGDLLATVLQVVPESTDLVLAPY